MTTMKIHAGTVLDPRRGWIVMPRLRPAPASRRSTDCDSASLPVDTTIFSFSRGDSIVTLVLTEVSSAVTRIPARSHTASSSLTLTLS